MMQQRLKFAVLGLLGLTAGVLVPVSPSCAASESGKGDIPKAEVSMVVPYSPEQVWTLISNPKLLTQEEPKVRKIRLLSRNTSHQDVEYQVSLTRLLPNFQYVLRYDIRQTNYMVTFHRLTGSFNDIQGFWQLIPLLNGKQTRIVYSLAIDPGFIAPTFLVNQAIKSDLPTMMKHVRLALDKTIKAQPQLHAHMSDGSSSL